MRAICVILCIFIHSDLCSLGALNAFTKLANSFAVFDDTINAYSHGHSGTSPKQHRNISSQYQQTNHYKQKNRQHAHPINRSFAKQQSFAQPQLAGIDLVRDFLHRNNMAGANNITTVGVSADGKRVAYLATENGFDRLIIERKSQKKDIIEVIVYTYRDNDGFIRARAIKLSNSASIEIPLINDIRFIRFELGSTIRYATVSSSSDVGTLKYRINLETLRLKKINQLPKNQSSPFIKRATKRLPILVH